MSNKILLIILAIFIIFNGVVYQKLYTKKEGYESLASCLEQGYPTSFCYEVPVQSCLTNCGEENSDVYNFNNNKKVKKVNAFNDGYLTKNTMQNFGPS